MSLLDLTRAQKIPLRQNSLQMSVEKLEEAKECIRYAVKNLYKYKYNCSYLYYAVETKMLAWLSTGAKIALFSSIYCQLYIQILHGKFAMSYTKIHFRKWSTSVSYASNDTKLSYPATVVMRGRHSEFFSRKTPQYVQYSSVFEDLIHFAKIWN